MIRYDMYRRYIDLIHDTYRDTYRIIYSKENIAETVIKNNIQTHYTCPIHFMQIWRLALNMFATLATGTFRNSPWDLGQGNTLTILFSKDNLTCTMSRRGAVTLMIAVTKELVSDSAPSCYHCHCDPRCMSTSPCYERHALPENGELAYRI